jgi:hypothetical protein
VQAEADERLLRTRVRLDRPGTSLTIGHVLPPGRGVESVTLDGEPVDSRVVRTARGRELVAETTAGVHELVVHLA